MTTPENYRFTLRVNSKQLALICTALDYTARDLEHGLKVIRKHGGPESESMALAEKEIPSLRAVADELSAQAQSEALGDILETMFGGKTDDLH